MNFSLTMDRPELAPCTHFVGRKEELVQIHNSLQEHNSHRRTVVLHGRGGMGKTQLAKTYAAEHHQDPFSAVIWLNARDLHSLRRSFTIAAQRIAAEHPETKLAKLTVSDKGNREDQGHEDPVQDVKDWLSEPENANWLIICDDYRSLAPTKDSPVIGIQQFLPEVDHGAVLITTRETGMNLGIPIAVDGFSNLEDSLAVLSTVSGREQINKGQCLNRLRKLVADTRRLNVYRASKEAKWSASRSCCGRCVHGQYNDQLCRLSRALP
jgi:hypothetical protein